MSARLYSPGRLNLLVVSKYLCCEMQVVIFRIVLHTDLDVNMNPFMCIVLN